MPIRQATYEDIEAMLAIFAYARQQMIADGNPMQWSDGYPKREVLEDDIQRGVSYVLELDREIYGTFVFVFGNDPTYAYIEDGEWLAPALPYGTVHRLASNGQKSGVFHRVLDWCSERCNNIRIDTHANNQRMIHLIEKSGFTRCGIIYTRSHSPRIAYQKITKTHP